MSTRLGALLGMRIAGSATADAAAAGATVLADDEVYAWLFGADWRAALARRGWDRERAARSSPARRRALLFRPDAERPRHGRATETLALDALQRALDDAGWRAADVELVVTATSTPDRITQSLSARLANALGGSAGALDVRAGGAGGLVAWATAATYLAGGARRALVVAAETPSAYLDPEDLGAWLVYGDGAAALALERDEARAGGLELALLDTVAPSGRPFTVDDALPPATHGEGRRRWRFQRPDATYARALERAWEETSAALRAAVAPDGALDFLPATATAAQLAAAQRGFGAPAHPAALAALELHGFLGAAALPAAVDRWRRCGECASRLALASVGGGVHRAALAWRRP